MKTSEAISRLKDALTSAAYSPETIKTYCSVVSRFLEFTSKSPSLKTKQAGARVESYLSGRVLHGASPATIAVEKNALLLFHQEVLRVPIEGVDVSALPPILSRPQVSTLIDSAADPYKLIFRILYGMGLKVGEVVRLRLRDVDFSARHLVVRGKKADRDRRVPIPESLFSPITARYNDSVSIWRVDHENGHWVSLPRSIEKKRKTLGLAKEWYWLFPASEVAPNPRWHGIHRPHISDGEVESVLTSCSKDCGVPLVSSNALTSSFAVHFVESLLKQGMSVRDAESKLVIYMGRMSRYALRSYIRLATPQEMNVVSPLDVLPALAEKES